jgi:pimeloyl-ACP methyl ester carboxylesterase
VDSKEIIVETLTIDSLTVLAERPVQPTHPPVLFIHGYFAAGFVFEQWLRFFAARGFPAYAINLRGREGSRPDCDVGSASILDFVDDAARIAQAVDATMVVGHSMGGLIAQKLAERGGVQRLALVCPAPPRGITVMSPRLAAKQVKYLPAILLSRTVHPTPGDLRDIVFNRLPRADQDKLLVRLVPDSGRAGREMSIVGVPVDANRVTCPMLVLTCEEDRFIPKRIVRRIGRRYGVPVEVLAGHAHMILVEPGWEVVADRVATWMAMSSKAIHTPV